MLEYSDKSRSVLDRFFKFRNDLDIYTEDKFADKEFYRSLFKRITDGALKISDIIPLGSKTIVLQKHQEYLESDKQRRKLFIVDGDLDLITDSNPKTDEYLFVHNAYCVENYLIDKGAAVNLIYYNDGEKEMEVVEQSLDFENWVSEIGESFFQLFIAYAILKFLQGGPVVKHVTTFLKQEGKSVKVDNAKINSYYTEIKDAALKIIEQASDNAEDDFKQKYDELVKKWPSNNETYLTIISGKDYLLPLLQFKINSLVGKVSLIPTKNIKLYLINHCDIEFLAELKSFINQN